jgi:hypothetical protein
MNWLREHFGLAEKRLREWLELEEKIGQKYSAQIQTCFVSGAALMLLSTILNAGMWPANLGGLFILASLIFLKLEFDWRRKRIAELKKKSNT